MRAPTSLGSHVRVADGRVGTVVYNGLDGVGIKWGLHDPDPADFDGTNPLFGDAPVDFQWPAEAMLRDPYRDRHEIEHVGEPVEILRYGLTTSEEP